MHSMDNAGAPASKLAERRRDDCSRRRPAARQLMLLVGAGIAVAAGAQPAAAAGWSIQSVPRPSRPADVYLTGVSCTSTRDCVAVGDANVVATDADTPFVEHWDGTTWSIERTPTLPSADGGGALQGVSCASSSACMAVGSVGPQDGLLAERWNGSTWSLQRPPDPFDAWVLKGVSCASSTECVAVGAGEVPVADRWDGRRWSAQNTHFDPQATASGLLSVSCPSRTTCDAVGADDVGLCSDPYVYGSGYSDYYVEMFGAWTSGRWSVRQQPNIACSTSGNDGGGKALNAISCTSRTACTAVGAEIYRWNGSRWSTQRAALDKYGLSGVSCSAPDACTAVGSQVFTWNGRDWSNLPIPLPSDAVSATATLNSVSCVAPDACVAVGDYQNRAGRDLPLIESER